MPCFMRFTQFQKHSQERFIKCVTFFRQSKINGCSLLDEILKYENLIFRLDSTDLVEQHMESEKFPHKRQ